MEMLETIRKIEEEMKIPIVLLPTHRSYIDFLVVSYIFFVYKLKMPYIVSDEALMTANLLPFLIKSSGAFFFRKKIYQDSKLYHIIFDKYV
jgi:glycerol-3-phosphate O-acyltransferase